VEGGPDTKVRGKRKGSDGRKRRKRFSFEETKGERLRKDVKRKKGGGVV